MEQINYYDRSLGFRNIVRFNLKFKCILKIPKWKVLKSESFFGIYNGMNGIRNVNPNIAIIQTVPPINFICKKFA